MKFQKFKIDKFKLTLWSAFVYMLAVKMFSNNNKNE